MTKFCNKCKIEKDVSEFYKDTRTKKDGLSGHCKQCHFTMSRTWQKKHPEFMRAKASKWSKDNPDKVQARLRKSRLDPEYRAKTNQWNATYKRNNKAKINAINAFRRAAQLQATPPWLTEAMKVDIQFFYHIRESMKKPSDFNVDHIVPLLAENARGLHVPWNLQIMKASDNQSKKNKLTARF